MAAGVLRFLAKTGRMDVLDLLIGHPDRALNINELSRAIGVPLATTWRAVQDLRGLGFILILRQGNQALVRLNRASPAVKAFIALEIPDPQQMAWQAFARRLVRRLPGMNRDHVRLFGSVMTGRSKPQSDVDVMVAYLRSGHSRSEVGAECDRLSNEILDEFGVVVSPLVVPKLVDLP